MISWWIIVNGRHRGMQETPENLAALQQLLDASYAAAGPHLMSVHGDGKRLSADELCTELQGVSISDDESG